MPTKTRETTVLAVCSSKAKADTLAAEYVASGHHVWVYRVDGCTFQVKAYAFHTYFAE